MKLLSLLIATFLVAAVALAQGPVQTGAKTHSVAGEVVSTDANANTITVKLETGETFTAPVDQGVATQLASLKSGDKVTLTCRDNDKGEHLVVQISKKKAAPGR